MYKSKNKPPFVDEDLLKKTSGSVTFSQGLHYYRQGMVIESAYDEKTRTLSGVVVSSDKGVYRLSIEFRGDDFDHSCDCENGQSLCKHTVALLLSYSRDLSKKIDDDSMLPPDDIDSIGDVYRLISCRPVLVFSVDTEHFEDSGRGISVRAYVRYEEQMIELVNVDDFWNEKANVDERLPVLDDLDGAQRRVLAFLRNRKERKQPDIRLTPIDFSIFTTLAQAPGVEMVNRGNDQAINIVSGKTVKFNASYTLLKNRRLRLVTDISDPDNEEAVVFSPVFILGASWWMYSKSMNSLYKLDSRLTVNFLTTFAAKEVILDDRDIAPALYEHFWKIRDIVNFKRPEGENNTIEFIEDAPDIRIKLDRSVAKIILSIDCIYKERIFSHPDYDALDEFYQSDSGNPLRWYRRDMQAEAKLLSYLIHECGFECEDDSFVLFGLQKSYVFLYRKLAALKKDYKVEFSPEFNKGYDENALLTPSLEFTTYGIDWFEFDIKYNNNGGAADVDHLQIKAALEGGRDFVQLKNGAIVPIAIDKFRQFNDLYRDYADKDGKFSFSHAPFLIDSLKSKGIDIHCDQRINDLYEKFKGFKQIEKVILPEEIGTRLRDYQKFGVDWLNFLHEFGFGGILADDMGIGKTVQALTIMSVVMAKDECKRSLVICPTTLVWNWQNEIKKFFPGLRVLAAHGLDRPTTAEEMKDIDIVVTSYALVRRDIKFYEGFDFCYVVLDEAQNIKNKGTQSAKAVKRLKSKYRLALTGTPLENSIMDVWSIFDFLMPGFLGNYSYFKKNYEAPIVKTHDLAKLNELSMRVKPFMLRRLKTEVLKELPAKIEQVSFCDLEPAQAAAYGQMAQLVRSQVLDIYNKKGFDKGRMFILTALLRLRQICCHPQIAGLDIHETPCKINLLGELVHEALGGDHKIVIFSQFTAMLALIKRYLDREHITYEYMDGSTKNRDIKIDEFNKNKDIKIFLLSLKVGGVGLNLTSADTVILYEPWWNPAVESQAIDRVHRIGQDMPVSAYRLIAKGTIEEKILALQGKKRDLMDSVIVSEAEVSKSLSWDDIKFLLDV